MTTAFSTSIAIDAGGTRAIDWLAQHTPLSRMQLKKALACGAVWLQQGKRQQRLRRATRELPAGSVLHLHYDPAILALTPPAPTLIADCQAYSVWGKPPGLLAQGTLQGDHCSLLRLVELQLGRPAFLVHRLDREARGLMLVAHTERAAAALSQLFQQHTGIEKHYQAMVHGTLDPASLPLRIDQPLDGRHACTWLLSATPGPQADTTSLALRIETGRKHQIRRHLAALGHPLLGDARYGSPQDGAPGLALTACRLAFRCPLTGQPRDFHFTEN